VPKATHKSKKQRLPLLPRGPVSLKNPDSEGHPKMISPEQLRFTAFHEAGHGVAAVLLGLSFIGSMGIFILPFSDEDENAEDDGLAFVALRQAKSEEDILKNVTYLLCGGIAERILAGDETHKVPGAVGDIEQAQKALSELPEAERTAFARRSYEGGKTLLRENWAAVEALAEELIKHYRVKADDISEIVEKHRR
jgi:ATP-dependent Zn protease